MKGWILGPTHLWKDQSDTQSIGKTLGLFGGHAPAVLPCPEHREIQGRQRPPHGPSQVLQPAPPGDNFSKLQALKFSAQAVSMKFALDLPGLNQTNTLTCSHPPVVRACAAATPGTTRCSPTVYNPALAVPCEWGVSVSAERGVFPRSFIPRVQPFMSSRGVYRCPSLPAHPGSALCPTPFLRLG